MYRELPSEARIRQLSILPENWKDYPARITELEGVLQEIDAVHQLIKAEIETYEMQSALNTVPETLSPDWLLRANKARRRCHHLAMPLHRAVYQMHQFLLAEKRRANQEAQTEIFLTAKARKAANIRRHIKESRRVEQQFILLCKERFGSAVVDNLLAEAKRRAEAHVGDQGNVYAD